jgi:hypothetical protein
MGVASDARIKNRRRHLKHAIKDLCPNFRIVWQTLSRSGSRALDTKSASGVPSPRVVAAQDVRHVAFAFMTRLLN